jgi:uncharacterized membrane protein YbhN (UPF0104 family)
MLAPDDIEPPAARRSLPGWASLLLRVAATAALMSYALRGVDLAAFRDLLAQADWRWWIAGLAIAFCGQVIAGVRWAALARPLGFPFSRRSFVWRFFEGSFFSLCLPSSIGGDVIKAYRIGDTTQRRLLAGCTVLADRLTGLAALGVLGGTALIAAERKLGLLGTALVAAALATATWAAFRVGVGSIDRILSLIPAPHPAREVIGRLLPYQQQPRLMTHALGWSLVVQAGGALSVALLARSLGLTQPLSVWFCVVPLVALAVVLPISINGVGVRENALAILLKPHGVPPEPAIAVGLLWLATSVVLGLVGGVLFLIDRRASARPAQD